jgi:hypothetical protein
MGDNNATIVCTTGIRIFLLRCGRIARVSLLTSHAHGFMVDSAFQELDALQNQLGMLGVVLLALLARIACLFWRISMLIMKFVESGTFQLNKILSLPSQASSLIACTSCLKLIFPGQNNETGCGKGICVQESMSMIDSCVIGAVLWPSHPMMATWTC